jgi:hypothetical protein
MCNRLYYLGVCKYTLWCSNNDEIAKRRISRNVCPLLSYGWLYFVNLMHCSEGRPAGYARLGTDWASGLPNVFYYVDCRENRHETWNNNTQVHLQILPQKEVNLYLLNVQQYATVFSLLHFCRQLYMFRVLTPIIRSWYSSNYSFWYWLTGSTTTHSRWVGTDSCVSYDRYLPYDAHESVPTQQDRMVVDTVKQYQKL